ncbi:unnamed protein product [Pedinophyceae sp. YPF-701]|nr:unnamed protein product [Pedinophyceae sp. YPF-701]
MPGKNVSPWLQEPPKRERKARFAEDPPADAPELYPPRQATPPPAPRFGLAGVQHRTRQLQYQGTLRARTPPGASTVLAAMAAVDPDAPPPEENASPYNLGRTPPRGASPAQDSGGSSSGPDGRHASQAYTEEVAQAPRTPPSDGHDVPLLNEDRTRIAPAEMDNMPQYEVLVKEGAQLPEVVEQELAELANAPLPRHGTIRFAAGDLAGTDDEDEEAPRALSRGRTSRKSAKRVTMTEDGSRHGDLEGQQTATPSGALGVVKKIQTQRQLAVAGLNKQSTLSRRYDRQEFVQPDLAAAEEFRNTRHPRWVKMDGTDEELPFNLNKLQLVSVFGLGVLSWFTILKRIGRVFVVMLLLSLPWVIFANIAEYTDEGSGRRVRFSKTATYTMSRAVQAMSFGTFGQIFGETPRFNFELKMKANPGGLEMRREWFLVLVMIIDLALCVIIWVTAMAYRNWLAVSGSKYEDVSTINMSDYAIMVRGLPPMVTTEELKDFFEKLYGRVVEVSLAANDTWMLGLYKNWSNIVLSLKSEVARWCWKGTENPNIQKVKHLEMKAYRISDKIERIRETRNFTTVAAYVVFDRSESMSRCVNELGKLGFWEWVYRTTIMPRHKRLRGRHVLRVKRAPSPDDIIFENLKYNRRERIVRQLLVGLLVLALIVGNLLVVTALRSESKQYAKDQASPENFMYDAVGFSPPPGVSPFQAMREHCQPKLDLCTADIAADKFSINYSNLMNDNPNLGVSAVEIAEEFRECYRGEEFGGDCIQRAQCYTCYCEGLLRKMRESSVGLNFILNVYEQCPDFTRNRPVITLVNLAATAFIVSINWLIRWVLQRVVHFEKHASISEFEAAICWKVAIAQFLNSGLMELVISGRIAFIERKARDTFFEDRFLAGDYLDLDSEWYAQIGSQLHLTVVLLIAATVNIKLVHYFIHHWRKKSAVKKATADPPTIIQERLNEAYVGPDFRLAARVAETTVVIMIIVVYGPMMPMLYAFGAIYCYITRKLDRHQLLRLCRQPARYGARVAEISMRLISYTVLVHLALASWAHSYWFAPYMQDRTAIRLFRDENKPDPDEVVTPSDWAEYYKRLTQINAFPLLACFVAFVAGATVLNPLVRIVKNVVFKWTCGELLGLRKLCCCCCEEVEEEQQIPPFTKVVGTNKFSGPFTFAVVKQERYFKTFVAAGITAEQVGLGGQALALGTSGLSPASRTWYDHELHRHHKAQLIRQGRAIATRAQLLKVPKPQEMDPAFKNANKNVAKVVPSPR